MKTRMYKTAIGSLLDNLDYWQLLNNYFDSFNTQLPLYPTTKIKIGFSRKSLEKPDLGTGPKPAFVTHDNEASMCDKGSRPETGCSLF